MFIPESRVVKTPSEGVYVVQFAPLLVHKMEMRGQSVANKVQNLSGFQNKVELLKMHIALLLRCSRATLGKGLSCSAPSPAGRSTAELQYTHAYCAAFSHLCCLAPSPAGWRYCRKLSTVCWNGVLGRHFLGIKMEHWNKCLSSLL